MNKTFIFFLLLILTACGTMNNQQGVQPFETRDALNDDEGSMMTDVSYQEGELTDIADRNPNFLDLNTENEAHNNRGAYQEQLRRIVESSDEFNAGMIYINGYRAIVNVTPKRKFSKNELQERLDTLEIRLSNAVPRYKIDVRVNTNNT